MSAPDARASRVTHAMEDYLKGIYEIGLDHAQVTTSLIAERMAVKPASVSGMLRALADLHLVTHTPYYGVTLTPAGQQIALEVLRHHRLIELYLVEALGFKWDEVHDEADRLEHVISEKFEARIADLLGDVIVYCRSEALKYGLPLEEVLDIIMDSNESKLGADGKPIYDANGKFLKGPNYWKPEAKIKSMLEGRGIQT